MRKIFKLALVSLLTMSMAVGCTSSQNTGTQTGEKENKAPDKVRVAYMPNMGSASAVVSGIEQGYFEEYGLDIELVQFAGGPAEIAALASGDIQIAQIGHGAHALCIEGEAKVFAIDALSLSDVVLANKNKGISSIEDLKGKKVAVQAGTSSEIILNLALEKAGMTQKDLEIIQMEASGMVSAMVGGNIDACATWEPSSTTIMNQMGDNCITLAGNEDFLEQATFASGYITSDKYAKENKEILVRFAKALLKAQDYRNPHIEEICKAVAKLIEADEATILDTKNGAKWLTGEEIKTSLEDGTIKKYYESQQQVFINAGRIPEPVPVEEYVMFDVMKEATSSYK